jgi:membrane protein required for colicin V production
VLRGAIKEIFNLIALIVSVLITLYHYDIFLILFQVTPGPVVNVVSTIGVFIISFIIIMLINAWILYALTPIRLNVVDRFFGFFLGFAKGVIFAYLIFAFINVFYYSLYYNAEDQKQNNNDVYYYLPSWVKGSNIYTILIYLDENINKTIPESVHANIKEFTESFESKVKNDERKKEIQPKRKS